MSERKPLADRTALIGMLTERAREEGIYAILRFEERQSRNVGVEGVKVEAVESSFSGGLGVQAFTSEGHCGFSSVDDATEERALSALDRAIAAARAAQAAGLETSTGIFDAEPTTGEAFPATPRAFHDLPVSEVRERTVEVATELAAAAGDLTVRTSFGIALETWRIARTDGTDVHFQIPRSMISALVTARANGEAVRTSATITGTAYELLDDPDILRRLAGRVTAAADLARGLLDAPSYPAGSYRLLIDFALAKGLAHEAFGHAAESDGLDSSILGEEGRFLKGEKFGNEKVTIVDESMEGDNAFQPFSGNGLVRKSVTILERGVLREALADVHTAGRAGTPVTGAARLSGFSSPPIPRMSNIRIEVEDPFPVPEGRDFYDWTPEEVRDLLVLAGDLKDGEKIVFLSGYRGGQVNPALGDFVFNSSAIYELTTDAVTLFKPGIFSGRIGAVLHSIARGYGPLRLDAAGMCGKAGQSVPSSGGSHHFLLIDENPEVKIGGRA
jgi:TldD protein